MSSRPLFHRVLAASGVAGSILALGFASAPMTASATATGKCIWYDADIPPASGSATVPLQDCGLHSGQTPEASYYWSDEARVIVEPRSLAFDYSAYSGLDPFATEYSLRKLNELFPGPSTDASALRAMNYAQMSLNAKARAVEQRRRVVAADRCQVVPTLWSDKDIADPESYAVLPPSPRPDEKTGTYTYSLSTTLTAEQRAVVIAGLAAFAQSIEGSRQPQLVEWASDDATPPVITFKNALGGLEDPLYTAQTTRVTVDNGRDGLSRWVSGNILLIDRPGALSSWTIIHELLHVYGFGHIGPGVPTQVLSETLPSPSTFGDGMWGEEPSPLINGSADACTKAGIDAAPAPQ